MKAIFCVGSFFNVSTFKYFDDWKVKLFGKFPVTLIVGRHSHDSTCSIARQYVVGNPDWDFFTVNRVYSISTSPNTSFFFSKVCTSQVRLEASLVFVVCYCFCLLWTCDSVNQIMFRSQNSESRTEKSIRTSGKDSKFLISSLNLEGYIGTR